MNEDPSIYGRVAGKIALVTGAASGIGQAAAWLLASEGATVAVTDVNEKDAKKTAQVITKQGGKAAPYLLDVTSDLSWQITTDSILKTWGRLDVVVNCAGLYFSKPIVDMTLAEWKNVQSVNLDGAFLGTQFGIRAMKSHSSGSIINVASASVLKASPGASAYCASKAAVSMLSKVAALECAQHGDRTRVNTILPGGVKTPHWKQMDFWPELVAKAGSEDDAWRDLAQAVPLRRFADADEIAQVILFLASDESSYITGSDLVVDGGFTA